MFWQSFLRFFSDFSFIAMLFEVLARTVCVYLCVCESVRVCVWVCVRMCRSQRFLFIFPLEKPLPSFELPLYPEVWIQLLFWESDNQNKQDHFKRDLIERHEKGRTVPTLKRVPSVQGTVQIICDTFLLYFWHPHPKCVIWWHWRGLVFKIQSFTWL